MTLTLDTWDCLFGALGKRDVFALALDRTLLFFWISPAARLLVDVRLEIALTCSLRGDRPQFLGFGQLRVA